MQMYNKNVFRYGSHGEGGVHCALFPSAHYHSSIAPTDDSVIWKVVLFFG